MYREANKNNWYMITLTIKRQFRLRTKLNKMLIIILTMIVDDPKIFIPSKCTIKKHLTAYFVLNNRNRMQNNTSNRLNRI